MFIPGTGRTALVTYVWPLVLIDSLRRNCPKKPWYLPFSRRNDPLRFPYTLSRLIRLVEFDTTLPSIQSSVKLDTTLSRIHSLVLTRLDSTLKQVPGYLRTMTVETA